MSEINFNNIKVMGKINFNNFDVVLKKCKELAIFKNKQYGVKNLLIFDGFGILTRMNDKMARLNNLIETEAYWEPGEHIEETLNDTLLDLINYTVYLYLYKNNILLKK